MATDVTDVNVLKKCGLNIQTLSQLLGIIQFERPVSPGPTNITGEVSLGMFTYMGRGCRVLDSDIGRYCSIGRDVIINLRDHPMGWLSSHPFQYDGTNHFKDYPEWDALKKNFKFDKKLKENRVSIGNDVWISEHVMIKRGVTIGDGAVIGAGAVVTKDVPAYHVAAGTPAKVIRPRFPDKIIEQLTQLKWWQYDIMNSPKQIPFDNPAKAIKILTRLVSNKKIAPLPTMFHTVKASKKTIELVIGRAK